MSNWNRVNRDPHKKMHVAPAGGRGSATFRANFYIIITPPAKFFAIGAVAENTVSYQCVVSAREQFPMLAILFMLGL